MSNARVSFYESNDVIDVARKRRALDAVRAEQCLRLAGIVELFDEEVRNSGVWQTRDLW